MTVSLSIPAPGALTLNRAAAVRLDRVEGQPVALLWRGLAPLRSWRPLRLSAADPDPACFRALLRLLNGGHVGDLPLAVTLDLWRRGVLLSAAERAKVPDGPGPELETSDGLSPPWLPLAEAGPRLWQRLFPGFPALRSLSEPSFPPVAAMPASFAADRWAWLPGLLTGEAAGAAAGIWRRLSDAGLMIPHEGRGARINNDPLGRSLLELLTPVVTALVGRPLRQSYCFAMDYRPGAVLPLHKDRAHCEYTLSLCLDGNGTWPLEVETTPGAEMSRFLQDPGDGLLFCGRELRHGRSCSGNPTRSLVLMLHWVDAGFPDADMDLS